ncbi:MAG: hypothetical protein SNI46_04225 [Rikenellaceae bacterium]
MKKWIVIFAVVAVVVSTSESSAKDKAPVASALILDLNANCAVTTEQGNMVTCWRNQVAKAKAVDFKSTEAGRTEVIVTQKEKGTGRPEYKSDNADINGHSSVVFRADELVNDNDDAFDGLITGQGYTWFVVLKPYKQHIQWGGPNQPNAFFGCLRNSGSPQKEDGIYAGFWGSFYQDGRVYAGTRNGMNIKLRDGINTPEVASPNPLPLDQWTIIVGRQGAGKGKVKLELFVDNIDTPVNSAIMPVGDVEPSRMAIGTERFAVNHQGGESFDGEIARFFIYDRELDQKQMQSVFAYLRKRYFE